MICLYKAFFLLSYYGLFRVGELALGTHTVKVKDVHIAQNKDKMMFILYHSKTHNRGPDRRRLKLLKVIPWIVTRKLVFFCPFAVAREYLHLRGDYIYDHDPFFIWRDQSPVTAYQVQTILRKTIASLNLDATLYNSHSFRIGRTTDLLKFGVPIGKVQLIGHWKSNVVFSYIHN